MDMFASGRSALKKPRLNTNEEGTSSDSEDEDLFHKPVGRPTDELLPTADGRAKEKWEDEEPMIDHMMLAFMSLSPTELSAARHGSRRIRHRTNHPSFMDLYRPKWLVDIVLENTDVPYLSLKKEDESITLLRTRTIWDVAKRISTKPAKVALTFRGMPVTVMSALRGMVDERETVLPLGLLKEHVEGGEMVHFHADGSFIRVPGPTKVRDKGRREWKTPLGAHHRDDDLPAVIKTNGTLKWYKNGRVQRDDDLPTAIKADGTMKWHKNGYLHRDGDKPSVIDADGTQVWHKYGRFHRAGDKPAVVSPDGSQEWCIEGQTHRNYDRPAVIWADGTMIWVKDDEYHREDDKPAMIEADGTQTWYKKGRCHRDGDKPAIIKKDGTEEWYQKGQRHRDDDKPAVISADGTTIWYQHGKKHRDGDMPALIKADGTEEWYQKGLRYPRRK